MADSNLRIPKESKDRLAAVAASEGLSLRAYLTRLSETLRTPEERAEQAVQARAVLHDMNGYAPTAAETSELDSELDRRLARAWVR